MLGSPDDDEARRPGVATSGLYRRVGRLNYFLADFLTFNDVYAGSAFTMSTSSAPVTARIFSNAAR